MYSWGWGRHWVAWISPIDEAIMSDRDMVSIGFPAHYLAFFLGREALFPDHLQQFMCLRQGWARETIKM